MIWLHRRKSPTPAGGLNLISTRTQSRPAARLHSAASRTPASIIRTGAAGPETLTHVCAMPRMSNAATHGEPLPMRGSDRATRRTKCSACQAQAHVPLQRQGQGSVCCNALDERGYRAALCDTLPPAPHIDDCARVPVRAPVPASTALRCQYNEGRPSIGRVVPLLPLDGARVTANSGRRSVVHTRCAAPLSLGRAHSYRSASLCWAGSAEEIA